MYRDLSNRADRATGAEPPRPEQRVPNEGPNASVDGRVKALAEESDNTKPSS